MVVSIGNCRCRRTALSERFRDDEYVIDTVFQVECDSEEFYYTCGQVTINDRESRGAAVLYCEGGDRVGESDAEEARRVRIIELDRSGHGVAPLGDRKIVVPLTVPGDVITLQPEKRRRKQRRGRLASVVEPSLDRAMPACAHFGDCGGCKLQHMTYAAQLAHKQSGVHRAFATLSDDREIPWHPIVPADAPLYYRNKLEYSFSASRWLTNAEIASGEVFATRNALGFHAPGRFDRVLHIESCHLQEAVSNQIRNTVFAYACDHGLSFYDARAQVGLLRNLIIRITTTNELLVVVVFGHRDDAAINGLLTHMRTETPAITALHFVVNEKGNDTIYDLPVEPFHGADYITETFANLRFRVRPKSFLQTNSRQADRMYAAVQAAAAVSPSDTVYDLYSGIGPISLILARDCCNVIGIEEVPSAVEDAVQNAVDNRIDNVRFYVGQVENVVVNDELPDPDVVICDPPRAGMHAKVLAALLKRCPRRIVYVSCNPKSQAEDVTVLTTRYRIVSAQPFDMFPQTLHAENVVVMDRCD